MIYQIKVKEIDEGTDYSLLVLSGMTGLSQQTIHELVDQGKFSLNQQNGQAVIKGKEFLDWAHTVDNKIQVEKTDYHLMEVEDK